MISLGLLVVTGSRPVGAVLQAQTQDGNRNRMRCAELLDLSASASQYHRTTARAYRRFWFRCLRILLTAWRAVLGPVDRSACTPVVPGGTRRAYRAHAYAGYRHVPGRPGRP